MHNKEIDEVLNLLKTSYDGLSIDEVNNRLLVYKENKLKEEKKENILISFIKQFKDVMIIVLLVVAFLLYIYGVLYSHDYTDTIVILVVVIINALVGLIQEKKAKSVIDGLKKFEETTCKVKRDGKIIIASTHTLVPGDIVILDSGDTIPADIRIISSENLKVDESPLTGESVSVLKTSNKIKDSNLIQDKKNMLFLGCNITNGKCTGVVVKTGMNTEIGKIAESLNQISQTKTPLELKIKEISKNITFIVFIVIIFVLLLSIYNNYTILEIIMLCSSLAVAAIPEGLPTVITITLSVGISNLAKKKTIVKQMQAVETLGSLDVICSDKTGTITQNKMTVKEEYVIDKKFLTYVCALCNDGLIYDDKYVGDPTETSLYDYLYKNNIDALSIRKKYKKVAEIPFDSERKLSTTINNINGKNYMLTKGSVDNLLNRCKYINGKNITDKDKEEIIKITKKYSKKALRVLCFAYKEIIDIPKNVNALLKCENDFNFIGLLAMIDPARSDVKKSVEICTKAGIKPIMITGDSLDTALAIAKEVGIAKNDNEGILGDEIDKYKDDVLPLVVNNYSVYARVNPVHKQRIVKAFKENNKVVAMTGDGVNDAPAIKDAHVGVGMGITGTDTTKSVSDIVLMDDSFSTIVDAVKEGRRIYNNIRNNVVFSLSSNFAEIFTIIIGLLTSNTILIPIYILFIDLVTDSIPSICLSFEEGEKDIMEKSPRGINKPLFTPFIKSCILSSSIIETIFVCATFFISSMFVNSKTAMSLALLSMVMQEIIYAISCRNLKEPIYKQGLFSNKIMNYGILIILIIMILVFITPIGKFINVTYIDYKIVLFIFVVNSLSLFIYELLKPFLKKHFKD